MDFQADTVGRIATSRMLPKPYQEGRSHKSHPPCRISSAGPTKYDQCQYASAKCGPAHWSERKLSAAKIATARPFAARFRIAVSVPSPLGRVTP